MNYILTSFQIIWKIHKNIYSFFGDRRQAKRFFSYIGYPDFFEYICICYGNS